MSMLLARPLIAAGWVVAALAAIPSPSIATAGTAPSYDALIAQLDAMPSMREAEALTDAAAARVEQSRALPNPSIAVEVENVYGSGPYAGIDNRETALVLEQPLELWGRRGARIDAARAEAAAAGIRRERSRWETAARLATAYAEAEAAQRRHALAAGMLSLAEEDARAVEAMVDEGREAPLRALQARSEVDAANAALDAAAAARESAFAHLAALALLDRPARSIEASLLDREPPSAAGSDVPLTVRTAAAELDVADRQVTVERRRARPDVSASIGIRRFRAGGEEALTLGVALTVPLFDRNRGGIRAAHAERRAAEARLVAERQEADAERLAAEAALAASASRTRAADASVATAEEAYRLARVGVEAGRIAQLELRAARANLAAARAASLDARLARVHAEIRRARLQGRAPFGSAP